MLIFWLIWWRSWCRWVYWCFACGFGVGWVMLGHSWHFCRFCPRRGWFVSDWPLVRKLDRYWALYIHGINRGWLAKYRLGKSCAGERARLLGICSIFSTSILCSLSIYLCLCIYIYICISLCIFSNCRCAYIEYPINIYIIGSIFYICRRSTKSTLFTLYY